MKRNLMAFKIMYPENSGVEYAINYDEFKTDGEIEIKSVDTVTFPIDKLDWMINALQEIKLNLEQ